VDSAAHAASQDIDYLVIGTIFPSESHPGGATGGTALIKNVTGAVSTPVIGIGGITASNAAAVVAAGACGVAVIGAIIGQRDPASAARRLADAIGI
jgi:thiamine-phosphate pyrophosphorylase